jgi:hypothetical protein
MLNSLFGGTGIFLVENGIRICKEFGQANLLISPIGSDL